MKRLYLLLIPLLASVIGASSCNRQNPAPAATSNSSSGRSFASNERDLQRQIETVRLEKDRNLRLAKESPIPEEERTNFKGLNYFPINPGYRFNVELKRYESNERVKMLTSSGEQDDYLRYGYIEFKIGETPCRLDVFKQASADAPEGHLFIPFRDATSGKETYGAGRYVDLEENSSQRYALDFNLSYNPYCAYNHRYSCPIPPSQNTLKAEIRAGEKNYHTEN